MPYTMAFQLDDGIIQAGQRPPQEVAWDQHPTPLLDDITSPLNLCSLSLSFFRGIPSPSHIHHCQFTLCSCHNNIFKGSELKVDDGQLFFQGNKENADLQLEGRGGAGRINQTTKTKVRVFSLSLYATMPYTSAFVGSRPFKARPQEVVWDWHPGGYYLSSFVCYRCPFHSLKVSYHNLTFINTFDALIIQGSQGKCGLWKAFSTW